MPDANEASGQYMQQKAAEELLDGQVHPPLLVLVCGVTPSECNLSIRHRDQSVIGDGDAMRIAAEVAQNVLRSSEWPFAVDDPFLAVCLPNQLREHPRPSERRQVAVKLQPADLESLLQSLSKLGAEYLFQSMDRQQEVGM